MSTPWHQAPIAVVDFETTGVDPNECMPVQVGVALFDAGILTAKRSALINPGAPIPPEATAIHGITDEMVALAQGPAAVLKESVLPLVKGRVLCGYNAQKFDRIIWNRFAPDMGDWIDPIAVVRHLDPYVKGKGRYKLTTACDRFGVKLDNAHNALNDCIATGYLLFTDRFRKALGDNTVDELLHRQSKRIEDQENDFQKWLQRQPDQGGTR